MGMERGASAFTESGPHPRPCTKVSTPFAGHYPSSRWQADLFPFSKQSNSLREAAWLAQAHRPGAVKLEAP